MGNKGRLHLQSRYVQLIGWCIMLVGFTVIQVYVSILWTWRPLVVGQNCIEYTIIWFGVVFTSTCILVSSIPSIRCCCPLLKHIHCVTPWSREVTGRRCQPMDASSSTYIGWAFLCLLCSTIVIFAVQSLGIQLETEQPWFRWMILFTIYTTYYASYHLWWISSAELLSRSVNSAWQTIIVPIIFFFRIVGAKMTYDVLNFYFEKGGSSLSGNVTIYMLLMASNMILSTVFFTLPYLVDI